MSLKTVEVHRYRILQKLKLKSTIALINIMNKHRLELISWATGRELTARKSWPILILGRGTSYEDRSDARRRDGINPGGLELVFPDEKMVSFVLKADGKTALG